MNRSSAVFDPWPAGQEAVVGRIGAVALKRVGQRRRPLRRGPAATLRSSTCGSNRAIWMPRLFSSASLTASSIVSRRVGIRRLWRRLARGLRRAARWRLGRGACVSKGVLKRRRREPGLAHGAAAPPDSETKQSDSGAKAGVERIGAVAPDAAPHNQSASHESPLCRRRRAGRMFGPAREDCCGISTRYTSQAMTPPNPAWPSR